VCQWRPGFSSYAVHRPGLTSTLTKMVPVRVSTLTSSSQSKNHIPLISLPAEELFRRVLSRLLSNTMSTGDGLEHAPITAVQRAAKPTHGSGLKKIAPYWYPYTTMAKGRWLGREILEVVSTEFRDRSMEYYVCCFEFWSLNT
jgi:hypothetical protein